MDSWMVEEPKWHWMMHQLLSRFQQQGTLCDTTLACSNGEAVKAHSCILAAASQRIRTLLDGVQSGDYTLQMGSVTSSTWRYILRFIYDGRVSLPSSEIQHVKDAAMRFQIFPLVELIQALERLRTREGANRKDHSSVQSCSSDVIVLEDDDEIVNEITDLNVSSDQSASATAELSCINSNCLEPVSSDASRIVNVSEGLNDIEMDEIAHQSRDSSVTVANLQTEASLSGHNESTVDDDERPVDELDVSDVFENGRPHDTKSGADVMTRSSPAESPPLPEERNESSDFVSKLIVPVSCFANNLNSEVEAQDSLSQPSAGFSHSKRDFSGDSINFEFAQCSQSSGDNRAIVCQTMTSVQSSSGASLTYSLASGTSSRQTLLSQFSTLPVAAAKPLITGYNLQHRGLSPLPMDLADRSNEPLLCISDVVSLSAQNAEFGVDKTDAHCSSSSSRDNRTASYGLAHQALLPVPTPVVSKSELIISEDQLSNSIIKSRIMQGSHVAAGKSGIFDLEKRNPTLTAMLSKEKSEQVLSPAPWPVLLVSRPETQNSNEIVMNTAATHDDDDDANPSMIRPHVIEPIDDDDDDDDDSPSSQSESQTLHDNQTKYLCGIAPSNVSLSYFTVPLHVQEFSTAEDLPAASLGMPPPSFSVSRPSVITSQQPTVPTLDNVLCKFKRPAILKHSSKSHFSFFTSGTQTPRKRMRRDKKGSKTNESSPDFGLNTMQKTLSSAALGSLVTGSRSGVLEYAWPGEEGQFNGCSKLASDGVDVFDMYQTPADQSSSTVKYRRRKRAFKNVGSDKHLDDELLLAPEFGTSTDHNYFMQPDSTVCDSQTLQPRIIDVYNFTDSETCGSDEKKNPPSLKGVFKATKRPGNKQCNDKNSQAKLQPDDSKKSQEPVKRKRGRCRKIPSEEQSLSRAGSSGIQFVGKEIQHEWVVSNNPRTTEWFRGKVIRLVKGTDGEPGCQYEVQYEGDDTYLIDHLLDDYKDGSLKFL